MTTWQLWADLCIWYEDTETVAPLAVMDVAT